VPNAPAEAALPWATPVLEPEPAEAVPNLSPVAADDALPAAYACIIGVAIPIAVIAAAIAANMKVVLKFIVISPHAALYL
jgi:hypothetical protein